MSQDDAGIIMYSDYVCPFCYLSRRSLKRYEDQREGEIDIDWRPFDLRSHKRGPDGRIDHSVEEGKDEAYFEQVRENVTKLKGQYGADETLSLEGLPEEVDSFAAQAASLYVSEEYPDRWNAFDDAVFEALWIEGRDIGDPDVLADLAASVGLDGGEIRSAVANEDLRDRLREMFTTAQKWGITGVPTFVYEGHTARGAGPPAQIQRLVEGY